MKTDIASYTQLRFSRSLKAPRPIGLHVPRLAGSVSHPGLADDHPNAQSVIGSKSTNILLFNRWHSVVYGLEVPLCKKSDAKTSVRPRLFIDFLSVISFEHRTASSVVAVHHALPSGRHDQMLAGDADLSKRF